MSQSETDVAVYFWPLHGTSSVAYAAADRIIDRLDLSLACAVPHSVITVHFREWLFKGALLQMENIAAL